MEDINIGQKILECRKAKGMTIRELAQRANVTASLLSQIERSLANPSINTLKSIAGVLGVPLFTFFVGESDINEQVVRSDKRKRLHFPESQDVSYELLSPDTNGAIEYLLLTLPQGAATSEALSGHDGEEVLFVKTGKLDMYVDSEVITLETGDSARILPFTKHRLHNPYQDRAEIVFAVTPPRF